MPLLHLINAIKELASARDVQQIQNSVVRSARNLIGADGATVVFRDGDLCFYAEEDAIGPLWKGQRFPMSACISGWVMEHDVPAVIPDIYVDPRIPAGLYKPTFVKSLVMIPVRTTETIAAIGNYWRVQHTPTEEELRLLEALADAAARAIENIQLVDGLERQVQARTDALRLKQQELEQFLYCVVHDLKSPLITIKTFLELVQGEIDPETSPQVHKDISYIRVASTKMDQLLDALLRFSHIGRLNDPPGLLSFNELVARCVDVLAGSIQMENITLSVETVTLPLYGDPLRLEQVWQNLIENAIRYMGDQPSPRIEIGVDLQSDPPVFFVRDNGMGLDPDQTERIFDIFTQLDPNNIGIGLGLTLVRKVVTLFGGRVWVESVGIGRGSCFKFTLPAAMKAPDGSTLQR